MISKELKKLKRRELVDVIYQLKKNEQQLQEQIQALEAALNEKRIRISDAGSIAEAAADIAVEAQAEAADRQEEEDNRKNRIRNEKDSYNHIACRSRSLLGTCTDSVRCLVVQRKRI